MFDDDDLVIIIIASGVEVDSSEFRGGRCQRDLDGESVVAEGSQTRHVKLDASGSQSLMIHLAAPRVEHQVGGRGAPEMESMSKTFVPRVCLVFVFDVHHHECGEHRRGVEHDLEKNPRDKASLQPQIREAREGQTRARYRRPRRRGVEFAVLELQHPERGGAREELEPRAVLKAVFLAVEVELFEFGRGGWARARPQTLSSSSAWSTLSLSIQYGLAAR